MSDEYLRLVASLTPTGQPHQAGPPTAPRDRFVLFALAYLADDEGRCTVSLNCLSALTLYSAPLIRASLRDLRNEHRFVEMSATPSKANTYQLNRIELEARQFSRLPRAEEPPVELLYEYGLDSRSVNSLHRAGIASLRELGVRVERFHSVADHGSAGFHEFLDVPGIGDKSARKVLDSYTAWHADAGAGAVA